MRADRRAITVRGCGHVAVDRQAPGCRSTCGAIMWLRTKNASTGVMKSSSSATGVSRSIGRAERTNSAHPCLRPAAPARATRRRRAARPPAPIASRRSFSTRAVTAHAKINQVHAAIVGSDGAIEHRAGAKSSFVARRVVGVVYNHGDATHRRHLLLSPDRCLRHLSRGGESCVAALESLIASAHRSKGPEAATSGPFSVRRLIVGEANQCPVSRPYSSIPALASRLVLGVLLFSSLRRQPRRNRPTPPSCRRHGRGRTNAAVPGATVSSRTSPPARPSTWSPTSAASTARRRCASARYAITSSCPASSASRSAAWC